MSLQNEPTGPQSPEPDVGDARLVESWGDGRQPCFLLHMKLTPQGASGADEAIPGTHDLLLEKVQELGGRVQIFFVTMGRYDIVAGVILPDDESAVCLAMRLAKRGLVTTETLKAFSLSVYQESVRKH